MTADVHQDLARSFGSLSSFLLAGGSPVDARQRLVELAKTSIPACDWACITMRPDDKPPRTICASDSTASEVDQMRYAAGNGPCLDAARSRQPVWSTDLTEAQRWPQFRELVVADGRVKSVLSFHLLDEPAPTALNMYSAAPGAFDDSIAAGTLFAIHATTLMSHADSERRAQSLGDALTTSRQIGAAVGILMSAHKLTEEQAFQLLRTASNHLNRKLHDVAREVTELGEVPRTTPSDRTR